MTDRQLGTIAFHDRLAAVGVGMPAVELRQSTRASEPAVRLHPLPDHVARAVRLSLEAPAPPFRTASANGGGRAAPKGSRRYRETYLVSDGANGPWDDPGGTRE